MTTFTTNVIGSVALLNTVLFAVAAVTAVALVKVLAKDFFKR